MVKLLRRFLVASVLMFWQGGFTFYAAVVVPLGAEVLDSHVTQGFITRRVTNYLNLAGAVALPVLVWDLLTGGDAARWRRWLRGGAWLVAAITLGLLVWLHDRVDVLLDPGRFAVLDRQTYSERHEAYLFISTVQWAACLAGLALTLWAWRAEDERPP
jgi:hypothetical protein